MNGGRLGIQSERKECAIQKKEEKKKSNIQKFDIETALTATVSSAHKWRSNSNFFRNSKFPSFTWTFLQPHTNN